MRKLIFVLIILGYGCTGQKSSVDYYNKGVEKDSTGDYSAALSKYDHALKMDPDYLEAYIRRGRLKEVLGDHQGSLADADSAMVINPDHPEAYEIRADAKSGLGDKVGAYLDWAKAEELRLREKGESIDTHCDDSKRKTENPSYINYVDSRGFSFDLPDDCEDITENELGQLLIKVNPDILFLAKFCIQSTNHIFSVAYYELAEKIQIDTAFARTIRHTATLFGDAAQNYRLVDWGTKKMDGKMLRYKISSLNDSVFNIMYYFMKDDYSNFLYEIKVPSRTPEDLKITQAFLEQVALSVNFINP